LYYYSPSLKKSIKRLLSFLPLPEQLAYEKSKKFQAPKYKSLAQTELTSEVFISSTSKSETDNVFTSTESHQGGLK